MSMAPDGDGTAFETDIVLTAEGVDESTCQPEDLTGAYDYAGTVVNGPDVDGDNEPDSSTWNGSGTVGWSGIGKASVSTEDELLTSVTVGFMTGGTAAECSYEAMSGSTTIEGDGATAVILYDGATDCDSTSTVTWTLNGANQGEVEGISCRIGTRNRPGAAAGLAFVIAALCGVLVTRRHARG